MTSFTILLLIGGYFLLLMTISAVTSKTSNNETFFTGDKKSPWFAVAFGMVGASLSGVTFISVPGWIADSQFSYVQVVLGYLVGYWVIAFVLLPLYYRNNLTSIYEFLGTRFGLKTQKTGAFFFFLSRLLGSAFRLFLVALVLQQFVFEKWHIPFELTVVLSILLIWIYTYKGGIKTIVYTDTLQTAFMLIALFFGIYVITDALDTNMIKYVNSEAFDPFKKTLFTDNFLEKNYFLKAFIGGMFVTICMTGLDQDMMQKNLTCKNLKEAQLNMVSFSFVLVIVTILFMILGALLYTYAGNMGIEVPVLDGKRRTDLLFPEIALNGDLGLFLGITFFLGLIAAAYSSADSALTALTTSFCVDFLDISKKSKPKQEQLRRRIHIAMSLLLVVVIIIFKYLLSSNVIDNLLVVAGYTYGPLLGLFAFGILTKRTPNDHLTWLVCALSVLGSWLLGTYGASWLGGYVFGYELLAVNGLITFLGLWILSALKLTRT